MNFTSLNWIDSVCLAITLWFAALGLWIGLVRSLFNLSALALAVGTAWFASEPLAKLIAGFFNFKSLALTQFLLVLFLFIIVYLGIRWIGKRIHKFLHEAELGFYNRLAGLGFGCLKAILICSLFLALLNLIPPEFIEPHRQQAYSFQLFKWANPTQWLNSDNFLNQNPLNSSK